MLWSVIEITLNSCFCAFFNISITLSVPSEYKSKIRQEIYFCQKFGIENHLKQIKYTNSIITYINSLLGRVSFVLQIEPDNKTFIGYKHFLLKLMTYNSPS